PVPPSYELSPHIATYTISLHDALPIWQAVGDRQRRGARSARPDRRDRAAARAGRRRDAGQSADRRKRRLDPAVASRTGSDPRGRDRKSTRLNSSHVKISYAVFCLKKRK